MTFINSVSNYVSTIVRPITSLVGNLKGRSVKIITAHPEATILTIITLAGMLLLTLFALKRSKNNLSKKTLETQSSKPVDNSITSPPTPTPSVKQENIPIQPIPNQSPKITENILGGGCLMIGEFNEKGDGIGRRIESPRGNTTSAAKIDYVRRYAKIYEGEFKGYSLVRGRILSGKKVEHEGLFENLYLISSQKIDFSPEIDKILKMIDEIQAKW